MSSMKNISTNQKQRRIMRDFKGVLEKYKKDLTAQEMLAIASHLVGTLIALQDHTKMTSEEAIQLVQMNIQAGNDAAILASQQPAGSA